MGGNWTEKGGGGGGGAWFGVQFGPAMGLFGGPGRKAPNRPQERRGAFLGVVLGPPKALSGRGFFGGFRAFLGSFKLFRFPV